MSYSAAISPAAFFTFGDLLRYLRRRAQLQQRDLAIAVGYSESQICRLEQNQRLPDLTILLARFIPALALADEPELTARLIELAAVARGECSDEPNPTAAQPRSHGNPRLLRSSRLRGDDQSRRAGGFAPIER